MPVLVGVMMKGQTALKSLRLLKKHTHVFVSRASGQKLGLKETWSLSVVSPGLTARSEISFVYLFA